MSRFCTKCGKPLNEGERCSCRENQWFRQLLEKAKKVMVWFFKKTGIGTASENSESIFEDGQYIVPDIIQSNDGEVPIKQYEAAFLRSRIRGQYAKGKLQVTNKRVLFRAAGMTYHGPIAQQYEFAINEIAGIEIKKKNRISGLNVLFSLWLNGIFTVLFAALFQAFAEEAPTFALVVSVLFGAACAVPFFLLYKKFWLKLVALCCGFGALVGTSSLGNLSVFSFLGGFSLNIADVIAIVVYILFLLNMILVSTCPDLVLIIKTKGASPAFEIRRKQFPTLFKQMVEYTDFGEVLPGKDVEAMLAELGAMIDDIQTMGDMAIEKWKQ